MNELLTHVEGNHVSRKNTNNFKCDQYDYTYTTKVEIKSHNQLIYETPKVNIDYKEQIQ